MRRAILRTLGPALALGGLLFVGAGVQAETIDYITNLSFSGGDTPGKGTYIDSAHGISIAFSSSGANSVDLNSANGFSSLVSFGQLDSSGTSATSPVTVTSGVTLDVIQLGPPLGNSPSNQTLTFVGSLSGTLTVSASGAYIQFNAPLTQKTNDVPSVIYSIVSGDSGMPGRVNISAPNTNNGLSTIAGQISLQTVPEPSSMAMLALGASATVLIGLRSRRRMLVQAAA